MWAAPALLIMGTLSFLYAGLSAAAISNDILRLISPMAVGFILLATYKMGRKVDVDKTTDFLMIASLAATYFIHSPWIFPLLLVMGGTISILISGEKQMWNHVKIAPPWNT